MSTQARPRARPIRVMQSFRTPGPTTNPYIHLLDRALAATEGVEHLRFDRRRAILGRYDVLQLHWPETLLGGSTRTRAAARRAFALLLRLRLARSRIAVVRTVHNVQPHEALPRWQQRHLEWLERRTDLRIALNDRTPVPAGSATALIPHGHYRDWFAGVPPREPEPGTLGFVGLVRPYKGVEQLLEAFATTASAAPHLRLRVAGSAADPAVEREVRDRAASDPRVLLELRHLSEAEFANTVLECAGLVLPYRSMHNSGAVLAALSLGRPVLVPRNEITAALAAEVGPGWVEVFDAPLDGTRLEAFAEVAAQRPPTPPDLSAREWAGAGAAHRSAFDRAIAIRRGSRA